MFESSPTPGKPSRRGKLRSQQVGDYARLNREYKTYQIELDLLANRTLAKIRQRSGGATTPQAETSSPAQDMEWLAAAKAQLDEVSYFLDKEHIDLEGGWVCLHAARRHAVYGLDSDELPIQAFVVKAEARKLVSWRADAIANLLDVKHEPLTAERIIQAMALRDEYFSNQYHKIWMVGEQLDHLLWTCAYALVLLLPLIFFGSKHPCDTPSPWSPQMIGAVFFFGLLGAAISTAGSLMDANSNSKIPERVANQFVTNARSLFGAGIGLAGYVFYQAKFVEIHLVSGVGQADSLTVAFAFGFLGEKLISNVLGSLSGNK
ncbi:hypothetical protein [Granulicella sibirica]|uniref:Uncharacterized protein n=1 Tax=Granulicella sibirica TaxID=2479048 RepID=A0A4Q0T386_9BACT|nr:hypothetical protein [Granulicella sibirica]RXH56429.1 hypothetical protein GRAN_3286 [Granulicella sibirica]